MAVKKNAAEAAGSENTAGVDNFTVEAENAADGAQEKPQGAGNEPETVKLVYIGPSLPKAMLKSNRVFEGTHEEIKKELAAVIEKFPLVEKLLVPVEGMAEKKDRAHTAGNILNKYYSDLVSSASAALEREV